MGRAQQRRNRDQGKPTFLCETLCRSPRDAQAREAAGSIADNDASKLIEPQLGEFQDLINERQDLRRMLARAAD